MRFIDLRDPPFKSRATSYTNITDVELEIA